MNPISLVCQNPLIPEGDYWVRLAVIDYLKQKPTDVADSWVAALVVERVHPEQHGTVLHLAVHGTDNATAFRQSFRDHFRCFDYAPHLALGRWARVQVVHAEFNGHAYSQVLCRQLRTADLNRSIYQAVEFEKQFGTFEHPKKSVSMLRLHRDTLLLTESEPHLLTL